MTVPNQRDPDHIQLLRQLRAQGDDLKKTAISRWGRVPILTADPATLTDGMIWTRSDLASIRARINGVTIPTEMRGTNAARIAYTGMTNGDLWYATDTFRCWRYNGTVWTLVSGPFPRCLAFLTATPQAVANSANQVILWDTELYDTDAIHDTVTNKSRMTVPAGLGGIWRADYQIAMAALNTTGTRASWVQVNAGGRRFAATESPPSATVNTQVTGSKDLVLAAGDFVELFIFQTSGGFLNCATSANDYLSLTYVGPS